MRDNGYDLRHYLEKNIDELEPEVAGNLHISALCHSGLAEEVKW
jgi:hypothetical protein